MTAAPTTTELLRAFQGRARKRFGQHFLASDGVIDRIVDAAGVGEGSRVLEIGPGPGVLTAALLRAGAQVTAIELDRDCAAHIRSVLPSVRLVEGDATAVDLADLLDGDGWRCVSNLPYNVGTRILMQLLDQPDRFDRHVLMLQREVGERMLAPPGDRKRGSLSVAVQARAEVERVTRVPPGAFRPPPKVDSVVLRLQPHAEPPPPGLDDLLRVAFRAPRKTLQNNLKALLGDRTAGILDDLGLSGRARPAELDLAAWVALTAAVADAVSGEDGRLSTAADPAG